MVLATMPLARFAILFVTAVASISVALTIGSGLSDTGRHEAGYIGLGLLMIGQLYYVRKKWPNLFPFGTLKGWMAGHRSLTAIGTFLIIVHAGDGDAPRGLAALALIFMLATALSGMTGSYIHSHAARARAAFRADLKRQGFDDAAIEEELFLLSFSEQAFRQWRKVHVPITAAFFTLTVLHVFAMILFGGVVNHG